VFQVDEEAEGLHSILNTYTTTSADLTVHNKLGGGAAANKLTTSRANGPLDTNSLLSGAGGSSKSSTSSNETH